MCSSDIMQAFLHIPNVLFSTKLKGMYFCKFVVKFLFENVEADYSPDAVASSSNTT